MIAQGPRRGGDPMVAEMSKKRCEACKKLRECDTCPLCGMVVCQVCAESDGESCCDGEDAKEAAQKSRAKAMVSNV